jgi:hypothetical protein
MFLLLQFLLQILREKKCKRVKPSVNVEETIDCISKFPNSSLIELFYVRVLRNIPNVYFQLSEETTCLNSREPSITVVFALIFFTYLPESQI